jgi:hypothetical protein
MTARKPKEPPKKRGRPTVYKPEYATITARLCAHGLTDLEIARFFNVSVRAINIWKAKHPDFVHSLRVGKSAADDRVERSLYHRAIGYTFEDNDGNEHHVPPDATSMIFWLKNRRKEQWRDVHNHDVRVTAEYDRMSDEELAARLREGAKLLLEAPKVIEHDDEAGE